MSEPIVKPLGRQRYEVIYPDGSQRIVSGIVALAQAQRATTAGVVPPVWPLKFTLPLPPSANNLYAQRKDGRRCLSREGREFKAAVKDIIAGRQIPERWYAVQWVVWADIITKAGRPRAWDVANREKILVDALFDCLMPGVNQPDKWIKSELMTKRHEPDKSKQRVEIEIQPY